MITIFNANAENNSRCLQFLSIWRGTTSSPACPSFEQPSVDCKKSSWHRNISFLKTMILKPFQLPVQSLLTCQLASQRWETFPPCTHTWSWVVLQWPSLPGPPGLIFLVSKAWSRSCSTPPGTFGYGRDCKAGAGTSSLCCIPSQKGISEKKERLVSLAKGNSEKLFVCLNQRWALSA